MERFFFDFEDGDRSTIDIDGHFLPDAEAARIEALRALGEILVHEPADLRRRELRCSVRTADGRTLYGASAVVEGIWVDQ